MESFSQGFLLDNVYENDHQSDPLQFSFGCIMIGPTNLMKSAYSEKTENCNLMRTRRYLAKIITSVSSLEFASPAYFLDG